MSYLDKRHERRRKKLAENNKTNEEPAVEQPTQLKRSDSRAGGERKRSASRTNSKTNKDDDELKSDKKQFMLKTDAFSEGPAKEDSESDSDDVKVDIQKSNQMKLEKINFSSEYFRPIKHGATIDFLLTPAPPGTVINCKIRKGKGILSDMQFYLEDNVVADIPL